jgi:deoxyribodipyrimidine photo-lyase
LQVVWLRRDLRLQDNPVLFAALRSKEPVVVLFILDIEEELGGASKWWLHHSLIALKDSLLKIGGDLSVRLGSPLEILTELALKNKITVYWNRLYTPYAIRRDSLIKEELQSKYDTKVHTFNGSLLIEPWELMNKEGLPFKVYSPFWRALSQRDIKEDLKLEFLESSFTKDEKAEEIESLNLLPKIRWDKGFYNNWQPGEVSAQNRLEAFLSDAISSYDKKRNFPGIDGTSRLSPHLHFGEISPRQIWHSVYNLRLPLQGGYETYLKEVVWREFGYHLLYHFPFTVSEPLNEKFRDFAWEEIDSEIIKAWQRGKTGVPLVDAGMRELWQTGWMHNRLRMIVASYLVKHLLIDWRVGAKWFMDTLVDADLASNTLGWQWVAGSGADAAPYFRVFNPTLQGLKFDPEGSYIRRWVPELRDLRGERVFEPWKEGRSVNGYPPKPIMELDKGRDRALAAFKVLNTKDL